MTYIPIWKCLFGVLVLTFHCLLCFLAKLNESIAEVFGDAKLVYEWTEVDFRWQSENERLEALQNGTFVPERNLIAGIKLYKDIVYVTIPRWRWTSGQPATLNKVVKVDGQVKLQPYPSWAEQKQGECRALQYVQSMEIDTNTGLMYVIDTGTVGIFGKGTPLTLCPAKIVVLNLQTDKIVSSHEFPVDAVSADNFLNDIVLHYVNRKVRYVYITDAIEERLHVFDFDTLRTHNVEHQTMKVESDSASVLHINGVDYNFKVGLDGIAMSPDFDYIYYSPVGGYGLYQLPTASLTSAGSVSPRLVGKRISQSDGLAYGNRRLYFGAMGLNAVYYWEPEVDMLGQDVPIDRVFLKTQSELVRDDTKMKWPDTFAWDNQGWLWFVSNDLHLFNSNTMDFSGHDGSNMRVWKVFVNETSYLYQADDVRTTRSMI